MVTAVAACQRLCRRKVGIGVFTVCRMLSKGQEGALTSAGGTRRGDLWSGREGRERLRQCCDALRQAVTGCDRLHVGVSLQHYGSSEWCSAALRCPATGKMQSPLRVRSVPTVVLYELRVVRSGVRAEKMVRLFDSDARKWRGITR